MLKKLPLIFLLLLVFCCGCSRQNSEFTLRLLPPLKTLLPLEGTWEITALLQEGAPGSFQPAESWVGKKLHFAEDRVLLGEYLVVKPRFQAKKISAASYLQNRQQVFPEDFQFAGFEISLLAMSDEYYFYCELLPAGEDELLLNLFNNSYLVRKISAETDEAVFNAAGIVAMNNLTETPGIPTGILLGLRLPSPNGQGQQFRTLWLSLRDGILDPVLETKKLIFPRRRGFFELRSVTHHDGNSTEDILLAAPIGQEKEPELLFPTGTAPAGATVSRRIRYIGNDFVSFEEITRLPPAGNSGSLTTSKLQTVAVDSLPGIKAVNISDLAGEEASVALKQGHETQLALLGPEPSAAREDNFALTRKNGYWIFSGRVEYRQDGEYKTADYQIGVIPPDHVVFFNELTVPWPQVKNRIPNARDVFTSPAGNMALVVTDSKILAYPVYRGNLADKPLLELPLGRDEEIIMAEWALGHFVENWTSTFTDIF